MDPEASGASSSRQGAAGTPPEGTGPSAKKGKRVDKRTHYATINALSIKPGKPSARKVSEGGVHKVSEGGARNRISSGRSEARPGTWEQQGYSAQNLAAQTQYHHGQPAFNTYPGYTGVQGHPDNPRSGYHPDIQPQAYPYNGYRHPEGLLGGAPAAFANLPGMQQGPQQAPYPAHGFYVNPPPRPPQSQQAPYSAHRFYADPPPRPPQYGMPGDTNVPREPQRFMNSTSMLTDEDEQRQIMHDIDMELHNTTSRRSAKGVDETLAANGHGAFNRSTRKRIRDGSPDPPDDNVRHSYRGDENRRPYCDDNGIHRFYRDDNGNRRSYDFDYNNNNNGGNSDNGDRDANSDNNNNNNNNSNNNNGDNDDDDRHPYASRDGDNNDHDADGDNDDDDRHPYASRDGDNNDHDADGDNDRHRFDRDDDERRRLDRDDDERRCLDRDDDDCSYRDFPYGDEDDNDVAMATPKKQPTAPASTTPKSTPPNKASGSGSQDMTTASSSPTAPGGVPTFLLEKWNQLATHMLERELQNQEFQDRVLGSVKSLEKKLAKSHFSPNLSPSPRGQRITATKARASRGMETRLVMDPQAPPRLSAEELLARQQFEKTHLNKLQRAIHAHFRHLLGFTGRNYRRMAELCPPLTKDEFEMYELSGEKDWFASRAFRVDFTRPWLTCSYNLEAREFFTRDLLRSFEGGGYEDLGIPKRYITPEHITAGFDMYMDTCRDNYRAIITPPAQEDVNSRRQRVRQNSRRGTLLASRTNAIDSRPRLHRHKELFAHLRAVHMSDDETDRDESGKKTRPYSFSTLRSEWMSYDYRKLMEKIDDFAEDDLCPPVGKHNEKGGNSFRTRIPTKKLNPKAVAPPGLWKNCYDSAWLGALKKNEVARLRINPEQYNFTIDEGEDGDHSSEDSWDMDE